MIGHIMLYQERERGLLGVDTLEFNLFGGKPTDFPFSNFAFGNAEICLF